MNYNTTRADLVIPEYGRHIQNMVNLAIEIKDEAERNLAAKTIIKVMGQYNPSLRDVEEFNNKLWDHLHIMSNYQLDVDSPFPKPTPEERKSAPEKPSYGTEQKRFKHKEIEMTWDNFVKKANSEYQMSTLAGIWK